MMCSRKMEREKLPNTRPGSRKMGRATSVRCEPKSKSLEGYVERGLFDSREQIKEDALLKIIEAFTNYTGHEIAQNKFATIMLRCLHFIKKGSTKEICLATKTIGLLAMIISRGDNAHELFEESLSTYSKPLNFEDASVKKLNCLAMVTFVGAKNFWEIEESMKILWQFIVANSDSKIILNEESAPVLTAAIFAWSFLLTAIDGWNLDNKYWQGAISYLLNLLKMEESVCAACVDALAIIFEKNCVEKFSIEAYKAFMHSAINKVDTNMDQKQWKTNIVEQIKEACDQNWEIVRLFEDENSLQTSTNIGKNCPTFSTLSQLTKMKFIKQFLGDGFEVHMQENELLHQVFDVTPKNNPSGSELYVAEIEEVKVKYFSPHIKKSTCRQVQQRFEKSPNSLVSKARTQFMKKQRMLAQERKIDDFRD
ncbi:hypothetical protein LOK49_LG02G03347 [Camellia lanceoleosa]|uniref:Uncharacterized protein n=1 Tax=Camellia lanceoleosa TaxID=1840588 RepID=A0ACC0IIB7_9ERIC|nr:hypothetical protein LOK49_LG02G03347 [Camellia lanceoleosa]